MLSKLMHDGREEINSSTRSEAPIGFAVRNISVPEAKKACSVGVAHLKHGRRTTPASLLLQTMLVRHDSERENQVRGQTAVEHQMRDRPDQSRVHDRWIAWQAGMTRHLEVLDGS